MINLKDGGVKSYVITRGALIMYVKAMDRSQERTSSVLGSGIDFTIEENFIM
ncbi:hypothetical protein P3S68_003308 [Capsicum galapagoense]